MKEGWKMVKAKDICKIQNGFAFDSKKFNTETGKPLIRIRDVKRGFTETLYDGDYTEDYIIKDGDLLIGMDGEFNMNYWAGGEAVLNQRVCKVEPNKEILKGYFFYIIQTYLKQIEEKTTFTTVKHLSSKTIQNIEFPLPPISEQTRIVSLLDDAFGKLERSREKALKLLDDAKEIFQAQLKKEMTPKKGWEVKTVKEIAFIKSGFAFKSSDFKTKGEYQVIRMGNVRPNLLRLNENPVFVSSENKEMIEKAELIEGDVIITQTGTKGKRDYGYTVMIDRKNLLLNQRIACVRFHEKKIAKFYMYYSWTEEFKNQFFADEGGTVGQGNVGISAIKDTKIPLPPLSEQSSIVSRLDGLSSQLKQIEEKTNKYLADLDELKQSLLKKAFEGKL